MNNKAILYLVGGVAVGYLIKHQMTVSRIQRLENRLRQQQQSGSGGLDIGEIGGIVETVKGLF